MSWKSVEQQAATMLSQTRQALAPQARTVVETGQFVPRVLERVVRREHRDLLVVGSSRHATVGRVRIGRRTRQLLHDLGAALAIAPRGLHAGPPVALRRIGVGFDGKRESEAAASLAASIARAAHAELHLCSVVDDRIPAMSLSAVATGVLDREALLDQIAGEVLGAEVPAGNQPEPDAEQHRADDIEEGPANRLTETTLCGRRPSRSRRGRAARRSASE